MILISKFLSTRTNIDPVDGRKNTCIINLVKIWGDSLM